MNPHATVRVSRRFKASPERVFDAWLDPRKVAVWMLAPAPGETVHTEIDARLGGRFRLVVRRGGEDIEHAGEYLEFDRPRRLVFTFGVPRYSSDTSLITVALAPAGTGTDLTLTAERVPSAFAPQTETGWTAIVDSIAAQLDAAESSPLEGEIRALHQALLRSWNARDAAAMAALFTPEGNVVGFDGSVIDGPAQIQSTLGAIFANHPTASYVAIVREVRALGPDAALLRAAVGMVPPGGSDINPAVNAIQSLVAERREGAWRVALFQNTPAAFHGRPELAQALTEELRQALRAAR